MSDEDRRAHLETLRETPGRLKAALKGVPKALAAWRPAPGKWSILEIVCHMRDMERDAYIARFSRILAEDEPALPDCDGDIYALERDYRGQKLSAVLRDWNQLRRQTLRILRGVAAPQWSRRGVHEVAGPLSMDDLLFRLAVGNDRAHLGQIEGIKARWRLFGRLEATPAALEAAVGKLSDEAARQRTPEGKWSPVELACHLRDCELLFVERLQKMAWQERPSLWMIDNDRVAEAKGYRAAHLPGVLRDFRQLRRETLLLLRALPAASWARVGLHPRRGEVTIEDQAGVLADHGEHHVARLARA